MAVVAYTETSFDHGAIITWASLANGDSGAPYKGPQYPDKSIQVTGTFGTGGNVIIEGSNFGSSPTYFTLNNTGGTALGTVTAAAGHQLTENVYVIRPRVSAGDGTTSLTVNMLVFASSPGR